MALFVALAVLQDGWDQFTLRRELGPAEVEVARNRLAYSCDETGLRELAEMGKASCGQCESGLMRCSSCNGDREVPCETCAAKGKVPCKACGAAGWWLGRE